MKAMDRKFIFINLFWKVGGWVGGGGGVPNEVCPGEIGPLKSGFHMIVYTKGNHTENYL